jgi:tetratricopeptide (TPR) repeat protein
LEFLENELEALGERMEFLGQNFVLLFMQPLWQFVHNFAGRAGVDPKILTGEIMNQDVLMAEAKESSLFLLAWVRYYCMVLAYFFGDYDSAEQYATSSHEIYDNSCGGMDGGSVLFYECMVLLAVARNGKRRHVGAVRRRLKRLAHWAEHCPLNFLGRQYMIEAELAAVTGNHLSVLSKYSSAILLSREGGFLMEEALANERAGKYYLERGEDESALTFLRESFKLYEKWGGIEKMRHLQKEVQPMRLCNY